MSDVANLVSLVSFLVAHEGISLRDAAAATHRTPDQLVADLNRLLMCGVPPYSPSDYIHYTLSGLGDNPRVHVKFASHFARPLNFAPHEVVALKYVLEHFARSAEPTAQAQLEAMVRALAEALHGRAHAVMADTAGGFVTPRQTKRMRTMIGFLSQAAEDQQLVEIEYYSAHRARLARRTVHPFAVIEIGAHFYLYAYCSLALDTRHFRVDRIRDAQLLDVFFDERPPRTRRAGRMQSLFDGRPKDKLVVQFSADVAREVIEEWADTPGVKVESYASGRARLELPLYNQFWAIGFIMGYGDHAKLVQPRWLRVELAQTLQKSLRAHEGSV
jgi:proteasome accessory factor C